MTTTGHEKRQKILRAAGKGLYFLLGLFFNVVKKLTNSTLSFQAHMRNEGQKDKK